MIETAKVEDHLRKLDLDDKTIALTVAVLVGGQKILEHKSYGGQQTIKPDRSTLGRLDLASGKAMAKYLNENPVVKVCRFRSEEGMEFYQPENPPFGGMIDDLDGSINPLIGGTNLLFIGVGGVIHQRENDEQIAAVGYLPFEDRETIYVAEKGKGTLKVFPAQGNGERINLTGTPSLKNIMIESGFMSPATLAAEKVLIEQGFYHTLGITARDRVTGGIFQAISGVKDNRQVILNIAPAHQADFCSLLLSEAGAEVIAQDGTPMHAESYAMLAITPSFNGDRDALKSCFVEAMKIAHNGQPYQGWNPGKVVLEKVCD